MKARNGILRGLLAACAVCVISAASYAPSPQQIGITSGRAEALVAIVALVLGLIGMNLGGLALARSPRSRSTD
jgi:hypothetical protein